MENTLKNKAFQAALATGTVLLGSASVASAGNLFSFEDLGSGSELRSELIAKNNPAAIGSFVNNSDLELKCGEGKCGEGKCGEAGKEGKKAKKAESTKAGEHKCGEGKCGEGKCGGESKEAKKPAKEAKMKSKAGEHKCGEGKCGEGKCGGI